VKLISSHRSFGRRGRLPPRVRGAASCLPAALLTLASLASARPALQSVEALPAEPAPTAQIAQRGAVSLEQATAMAQRQYSGRVVRAETKNRGGRTEHEIRILGDDGRVRTVRIDAQTGQFL
jgi:hypothetical protein